MIGTLNLTVGQSAIMAELSPSGESSSDPTATSRVEAQSSIELVRRARTGDTAAENELCVRYLPRLQRWAHGRLPAWARGSLDTHDLVQDTFMQVLQRLDQFEPRHEGAFQGYLRQALFNRVRDEIRRATRRGPASELNDDKATADPSPLEQAIGQETLERYEAALARLREEDREAIILRIELGYPYSEIVTALGKPSVAAAHMAVSRALVRLAEEMSHERT
jgi:RNA polymerase sigma-70 factor (ECF subfamily)